jgi:hypothetical protein
MHRPVFHCEPLNIETTVTGNARLQTSSPNVLLTSLCLPPPPPGWRAQVGSVAHMVWLERTGNGPFGLADCLPPSLWCVACEQSPLARLGPTLVAATCLRAWLKERQPSSPSNKPLVFSRSRSPISHFARALALSI